MLLATPRKFQKQTVHQASPVGKMVKGTLRKIPLTVVWIFFGLFTLAYGFFLLMKYTLFAPENLIKKVDYALSSVQQYDNAYLYKAISTQIKGENFSVVSWHNEAILKTVQSEFPFVLDVLITYKSANRVFVKVLFDQPQLIMRHQGMKFGVYNGQLFEIFSGNTIGSGTMGLEVLTFSSGVNMLTGVFFQRPADVLIEDLQLLKQGFPEIQGFEYMPGGQRTVVLLPGKRRVYINNMISIQQQIKNYQLLQKYYSDFKNLKEIDLGSLESDKVIVSK